MAPGAVIEDPTSDTQGMLRTTIKTPLPNPSLQVTADHNLKQQDAPVYAPAKGEVLLHIKTTGVCGYIVSVLFFREYH
jgi:L-iditol 2-dehydrogenase